MARLTDTQKSLVILGAGVLVAAGFGIWIYLDLQEKAKVEEQIQAQKAQYDLNDKEIQKIPALKKEAVAYRKIVSDNAKILPTEDDINAFIKDLATMEKDSGIAIRTLPVYNPSSAKIAAITKFPMKMQLTASTRAFLRFLNQLENRERLVTVTGFRITPAPETEVKMGVDAEHDIAMEFELFRYDPRAGNQGDFATLVKPNEESTLLEDKGVKDIIAAKGRPANLERYQLLPSRDNRPDMFLDRRRRTTPDGGTAANDPSRAEEALLELLRSKVEKAAVTLESFRVAEQSKDFLRMAALKREFVKLRRELDEEIKKVAANNPEFKRRDLQERYLSDVKTPYEALVRNSADLMGDMGGDLPPITETLAAGLRKNVEDLVAARKWAEAADRWNQIDALVREAQAAKRVEEAARPHIEKMQVIGEHARFQAMLAEKKIVVSGIIRMEKGSAAIVNGVTLFPGKSLDKDVTFVRAAEGAAGEGDRLIFKIQGHEVDYVQPKPQLVGAEKALLTQD
jgi:Tfp pilus assembly protein PilO